MEVSDPRWAKNLQFYSDEIAEDFINSEDQVKGNYSDELEAE